MSLYHHDHNHSIRINSSLTPSPSLIASINHTLVMIILHDYDDGDDDYDDDKLILFFNEFFLHLQISLTIKITTITTTLTKVD